MIVVLSGNCKLPTLFIPVFPTAGVDSCSAPGCYHLLCMRSRALYNQPPLTCSQAACSQFFWMSISSPATGSPPTGHVVKASLMSSGLKL